MNDNVSLTKSAKKSLAIIYKAYCEKVKGGARKDTAAYFKEYPEGTHQDWIELKQAGFIQPYVLGDFTLTIQAIQYMESRTADTITEWLSFVSQFIP